MLGETRANQIAAYLDEGNIIPGAIILSAQKGAIKSYNPNSKKLVINDKKSAFLVIDGHRLYGGHRAKKKTPFPVCIIENLSKQEEVRYFLDVNGFQRNVPRTLRLELTKFTAEMDSEDAIYNALFANLDESSESPLAGKMVRTKSVTGKISHVAFRAGVGLIIDKPPFNTFNINQKKRSLINYLKAVDEIVKENFDSAPRITNAAFFQAIMGVFCDACDLAFRTCGDYKIESFKSALEPISKIEYELHKGTNKKAIKEFTETLRSQILLKDNVPDELF